MKSSELTGALLDYWVAKAEGVSAFVDIGHCWRDDQGVAVYAPSTAWSDGGPLIEAYRMYVDGDDLNGWSARTGPDNMALGGAFGPTPLVAICRAVVRAKFGDEVSNEIL